MSARSDESDHANFERHMQPLLEKLSAGIPTGSKSSLYELGHHLIELSRTKPTRITHSVMQLICAKHLLLTGYDVKLEYVLESNLRCDMYAVKGDGVLILEVETGNTPPTHSLDPTTYGMARLSSKIARYSSYSNKFGFVTSKYNVLPIPTLFNQPARYRSDEEVKKIKKLCDLYYSSPPIPEKQLREGSLQSIHVIDLERRHVVEVDPPTYQEMLWRIDNVHTWSSAWAE